MSFALTAAAVAVGTLTATSSIMSMQAANDAAQAQQESIAATTRMNYLLKQQEEEELKAKAGMEMSGEQIKRLQERGKMQAAQAESGVAGASPLRELMSSYLQESLTQGSIISKAEAEQRTIALQNQSTYLQGLSQINQLESQKTNESDAWTQSLISGAVAGLSVYSAGGGFSSGTPNPLSDAGGAGSWTTKSGVFVGP